MAAGSAAVLTNFIINLITCIVCCIVFSFLRVSPFARRFFAPRRYAADIDLKPARLPSQPFSWVWPLLTYREEAIIDETGLDAAIYLRVLTYGLYLFSIMSVWCMIAVLPVHLTSNEVDRLMAPSINATTGNITKTVYKFTDFDKYTLANIPKGSQKMWVHLISIYFVTIVALCLLWRFSKQAVLLRIMFLANAQRGGPSHTVLVTDIPGIADVRDANAKEFKAQAKAEEDAKKLALKAAKKGGAKGVDNIKASPTSSEEAYTELADISLKDTPPALATSASAPPAAGAYKSPKGLSRQEIEMEMERERLRAQGVPSRRLTKRYNYDLDDTSLEPKSQALAKVAAGVAPQEIVQQEFELVYSKNVVAAVNMVMDQSVVGPLVAEYDQVQMDLEDYLSMAELRFKLRKEVPRPKVLIINPKKFGEWGTKRYGTKWFQKVDGLDHWVARLQELKKLIEVEQAKARKLAAPSAFVTFNTRAAQCTAAASLHHHDVMAWKIQNAPAPGELQWGNVGITTPVKSGSVTTMWVLFWLMTFFFMIPVGAIQALIDVPKLATIPVLGAIVSFPVVKVLLEAVVPGIVLKIFLAIVPMILAAMMKAQGANSDSEIDFGVVKRYFLFQVVVVFLGSTLSGSFFNQVNTWIKDPTSVITILGTAIPMVSTFFITYVLVLGLGAMSISFLKIVGIILFWLFSKMAGSPRKKERLWSLQFTTMGVTVVQHNMVILLGLVYCVINPIICLACLSYFIVGIITERYNTIYVYRRTYESAGRLWRNVFNQIMICIYFFLIVMLGLLAIKAFKYIPILIPLILGTIGFHVSAISLFSKPWEYTSLHDASELDALEAQDKRLLAVEEAKEKREREKALAEGRELNEPLLSPAQRLASLRLQQSQSIAAKKAASAPVGLLGGALSLVGVPSNSGGAGGAYGAAVEPEEEEVVTEDAVIIEAVEIPPMTEEEKKEIAEVYLSPVFKVKLSDVANLAEYVRGVEERITADEKRRSDIKALSGPEKEQALLKEKAEAEAAQAAHMQSELTPDDVEDANANADKV